VLALKLVKQNYSPSEEVLELLGTFRKMVNVCLGIGLVAGVSSLKKLSLLSYRELKPFDCPSYYKLCAISKATGILAARRKSLRRGYATKSPYTVRPHLVAYYGFKIQNGLLRIPIGQRRYFDIPLVKHTFSVLSEADVRVRSLTLTAETVGLCISKEGETSRMPCYRRGY
jgi:hypothetical protein